LAQRLADYLRIQGFTVADIRPVDFSIGTRYFFEEDHSASERLVKELGRFLAQGALRASDHASDFTRFAPKLAPHRRGLATGLMRRWATTSRRYPVRLPTPDSAPS
jgi:hypothetical protein